MIVYFSNVSNNTHKFVQKLDIPNIRIPLSPAEAEKFIVEQPYILITPTYGAEMNHVPHQVKKFLKSDINSGNMKGIIGSGNTNFGDKYGVAAKIISQRFQTPLLYIFELLGAPEDVERVQEGLHDFFTQSPDFPQYR